MPCYVSWEVVGGANPILSGPDLVIINIRIARYCSDLIDKKRKQSPQETKVLLFLNLCVRVLFL